MSSTAAKRPVHTFSIVARDVATGELGVAVQSHWFNVGPVVAWAEPGVGALATQSFANVSFGPRGLALMRAGDSPTDVLATLLSDDDGEAVRQVALVDAQGRVAAHTGGGCIAWADHATGDGWSAQANMMNGPGVVSAMGKTFQRTEGPLAERLLAALDAAQDAGGDLRGQQSAAIRVVGGAASRDVAHDVVVDLRVEDNDAPLAELRRIYIIHRAYTHMNAGDAAVERGDLTAAMHEYAQASELQPDNLEIRFWTAFTMATNGRLDDALPVFENVFNREHRWVELLRRLPRAGLCDESLVEQIVDGADDSGDGRR